MRLNRMMILSVSMLLLAGCQSRKPDPVIAPPANDDTVRAIRMALQAQQPGVLVGAVAEVLPAERLAAVRDVPVTEFHPNEIVVFIDSNKQPIGSGRVVRVTDDMIHVRWDQPGADHRAPQVGDLLVK